MRALLPHSRGPDLGRAPFGPRRDADLLPIALVLWAGSAARVALAVVEGEVFGVEGTLALGCLIFVPFLVFVSSRRPRSGDR